jgi:hypothetical protein
MFKRTRWVATGLAIGVGGSWWVQRKAKALASRYRPAGLAAQASQRVGRYPGEVKAAIREGRMAMREREAELKGIASYRETGARRGDRVPST